MGKDTDEITISQCKVALHYLRYSDSVSEETIKRILQVHRDITMITNTPTNASAPAIRSPHSYMSILKRQSSHSNQANGEKVRTAQNQSINFEEFCVIAAYLSVLQQEQNENTCVSPIKGTNLQPPPIYLTNAPGEEEVGVVVWSLLLVVE